MASIREDKLEIPLSCINEGISTFTFQIILSDLLCGGMCVFPRQTLVTAEVTVAGEDYLVDLCVESEGDFICDRCNEAFTMKIQGKEKALFSFAQYESQEIDACDFHLLLPSADALDISRDVKDALLLAIPGKCLCDENCQGICPSCGANLNSELCTCRKKEIDSRWGPLKNLNFEKES